MSKLDKIPYIAHYAIITQNNRTIYHEGDERSRTNPGHGYPAYSETIESIHYEYFSDRKEWENKIKSYFLKKENFRAFEVKPVSIETDIVVKINDLN